MSASGTPRVRFAPSPTGYLHVGGARTAIFNGLEWLGLGWDEPPVYQGANLERHRADAERMLANGSVYRCFCTQGELEGRRKEAEARKESFKYDRRCDRL